MKGLIVIMSAALLTGCATSAVQLDQELIQKNQAVIKDSVSIPGISADSSTLIKIDGKETDYTSFSNTIKAGKHELVFKSSCKGKFFTKYYDRFVINEKTENLTLLKGHTYKISPKLVEVTETKDFKCLTYFTDITKFD